MSKTNRVNHRRAGRGRPKAERHISVRSVRRDPPDLRKLSRAVIAIALREAELDAEATAARETMPSTTPSNLADGSTTNATMPSTTTPEAASGDAHD